MGLVLSMRSGVCRRVCDQETRYVRWFRRERVKVTLPSGRKASRRRSQEKMLKVQYRELFEEVRRILTDADPIHIALEDVNPDEYEPEVGTILPRLKDAESADDVRRIIHEEFVRWFSPEIAGPEGRYQRAAAEVWEAWRKHRSH